MAGKRGGRGVVKMAAPDARLADKPIAVLRCHDRAIGHAWDPPEAWKVIERVRVGASMYVTYEFGCGRGCETVVRDRWEYVADGTRYRVKGRRYTWTDEYRVARGEDADGEPLAAPTSADYGYAIAYTLWPDLWTQPEIKAPID